MPNHSQPIPKIERHKTAIVRPGLSRPVRLAFEARLFEPGTTFFDYGCGYGVDVKKVAERGHVSDGWDPYYFPNKPLTPADIVNIGYVINVIEFESERRSSLTEAWFLSQKVLLVAARIDVREISKKAVAWNDGYVTSRNTFQKYYKQPELKNYIDTVLGVDAAPAGPGVYFVFRDERQDRAFRSSHLFSLKSHRVLQSPGFCSTHRE